MQIKCKFILKNTKFKIRSIAWHIFHKDKKDTSNHTVKNSLWKSEIRRTCSQKLRKNFKRSGHFYKENVKTSSLGKRDRKCKTTRAFNTGFIEIRKTLRWICFVQRKNSVCPCSSFAAQSPTICSYWSPSKILSVCEWNVTKTSSLEKGYKLILPTQTSLFLLKVTEAIHNTSLPGFILEVHEKKTHEYKNISSDYNIQLKVF